MVEALRSENPVGTFWEMWFRYCVNVLVMYIAAALIAGLLIEARAQFNSLFFLLAFGVSAVVYLTYRRYVDDVRETSAKAERADRARWEVARIMLPQVGGAF